MARNRKGSRVIQTYVMVGNRGRVTLPRETAQAMGLLERQWLRLSVLDDGRALLEHVPPEFARVSDLARTPQPGSSRSPSQQQP